MHPVCFNVRAGRSQSATEYVVTYGWMVLIVVVVLGVLFGTGIIGGGASVSPPAPVASGFGGIIVNAVEMNTTSFELSFSNNLGVPFNLTNFSVSENGKTSSVFICTFVSDIRPGQDVTCFVPVSFPTTRVSASVVLNYTVISAIPIPDSTTGLVSGVPSTQPIPISTSPETVNVTITSTAQAAAPFQQEITFDPSSLPYTEASNLGNIRFYNGTQELYSWCESGCSTLSNQSIFWVKLPNGLPANKPVNITMVFLPSSNYDGVYAGEAPQLSPTYGQYDNGANVFNFYDNFVGTTLSNKWSSSGTVTVDNGIQISNGAYIISNGAAGVSYTQSNNIIAEALSNLYGSSGSSIRIRSYFWNTGAGPGSGSNTGSWLAIVSSADYGYFVTNGNSYTDQSPLYWEGVQYLPSVTAANGINNYTFIDQQSLTTAGLEWKTINYPSYSVLQDFKQSGTSTLSFWLFYEADGGANQQNLEWVRTRAYPPNGIMPLAVIGHPTQVPITLTNTQSAATPAPFQQELSVDSRAYSQYESSNLNNIVFTYSNGSVIPSWMESGNLAGFNGASSKIITTAASLGSVPCSVTILGWAYDAGMPSSGNMGGVVGVGSNGNSNSGWIDIEYNDGTLRFEIRNETSGNAFFASGNYKGKWMFVAAVDKNGTPIGYVNGQKYTDGSVNIGCVGVYSTTPQIGVWDRYFNGSIADVQVYSGALSSAQINQIYSEGMAGAPLFGSSLAGWWPLASNASEETSPGVFSSSGVTATNINFNVPGSGSTNTIYWLKLANGIAANSQETINMNFYPSAYNVLNNEMTGEAPQLSTTYGQYDDGANVFNNYFSGNSLTGWTTAGTSGQTNTAPVGNLIFGTNAFYANGAGGDYLYTTALGQSTNSIIEFYGYTQNLQDIFFLANSTGAGQMMRDGNGGGWYGLASTSSWTSWSSPPDTGSWSNEWVTVGVVIASGSATGYLSVGVHPYGSEIGSNPSNQFTVASNGNYLGLIGDGASGSTTQYWSGVVIRAYPPNGVMPSAVFGSPV